MSGSLATFDAIRRASSRVSRLAVSHGGISFAPVMLPYPETTDRRLRSHGCRSRSGGPERRGPCQDPRSVTFRIFNLRQGDCFETRQPKTLRRRTQGPPRQSRKRAARAWRGHFSCVVSDERTFCYALHKLRRWAVPRLALNGSCLCPSAGHSS
jgi:hypothetical protein